jgi:flavin reductase (DIM6/NTAB) family NADH-FMN oxidoreductase RutF
MNTACAEQFREAMRLTASGVTVVTTAGPAGQAGLTVSSLSSLSMSPPSVILCVHKDSQAITTLLENKVFAANELGQGQERIANAFAGLIPELREDRFAVSPWSTLVSDAPTLDAALCAFDCTVAQTFTFGTHIIVVGEVVALKTSDCAPLVFSDRKYMKLSAII